MRLFRFEVGWAKVAFAAVLPEGTALPHGISVLAPEKDFARAVAQAPFEQALGLRLSLWLVTFAPLALLSLHTLGGIPADRREAALDRLLGSSLYPIRQLALAFKAFAALIYTRSPIARAFLTKRPPTRPVPIPIESGIVTLRTKDTPYGAPPPAPSSSGVLPADEPEPDVAPAKAEPAGGPRAA